MKAPWTLLGGIALSACSMVLGTQLVLPEDEGGLPTDPAATASRETPIVRVVREVGPTVVNLYSELEFARESFLGTRLDRSGSLGAGVIVHPSGLVVTNAHVITANLQSIRSAQITVSYRPNWSGGADEVGEAEQYTAEWLGFNPENDLALLRIRADRSFPAARLGTSSDLMIGETVVAVGNPYGREGSVTHGIISAIDRDLDVPGGGEFQDLIQTDAPLNAGNSGGPLFNILGELIGINQAIGADQRLGRADGQGLAIPVDRVRRLIEEQFTPFELGHGYLGREVGNDEEGVRVRSVDPAGPAAAAGLRVDDRIVRLGEFPVRSSADFHLSVLSQPRESSLELGLQRGARSLEVQLAPSSIEETVERRLGVQLEVDSRVGRPLVERVYADGPADQLGVLKNDLLLALGGRNVRTFQDLFRVMQELKPGQEVDLVLRRYRQQNRNGWRYPEDLEGKIELR